MRHKLFFSYMKSTLKENRNNGLTTWSLLTVWEQCFNAWIHWSKDSWLSVAKQSTAGLEVEIESNFSRNVNGLATPESRSSSSLPVNTLHPETKVAPRGRLS